MIETNLDTTAPVAEDSGVSMSTNTDVTDAMRNTAYAIASITATLMVAVVTLSFSPLTALSIPWVYVGFGLVFLMFALFSLSIAKGLSGATSKTVKIGAGNKFDHQAKLCIFGLLMTCLVVGFAVFGEVTRKEREDIKISDLKIDIVAANTKIDLLESEVDGLKRSLKASDDKLKSSLEQIETLQNLKLERDLPQSIEP